jgi:hypothetical protein
VIRYYGYVIRYYGIETTMFLPGRGWGHFRGFAGTAVGRGTATKAVPEKS